MSKKRLATVWLDGCSGCHMSLLDIDERIIALAGLIDLVYSPWGTRTFTLKKLECSKQAYARIH